MVPAVDAEHHSDTWYALRPSVVGWVFLLARYCCILRALPCSGSPRVRSSGSTLVAKSLTR